MGTPGLGSVPVGDPDIAEKMGRIQFNKEQEEKEKENREQRAVFAVREKTELLGTWAPSPSDLYGIDEYERKRKAAEKADEEYKHRTEKTAVEESEKAEHDRTLATKVIFQSDVNNLYLHFDGRNPGIPNLRYAGDYSFGLETRHEVVPQAGETGLIHILCLRNHKYWSNFNGDGWITAMADKPKEEESDKQCTLFRPIYGFSNKKKVLKLQHVNTGHYVRMFQGSGQYDGCLYLYPKLEDVETFTFIDWEKIAVLPDVIRIKGDNKNHLEAGRDGYIGFFREAVDYPPVFDFEVSPSRDGGVRLKSAHFGKYLTDMDDGSWVLLKEASTTAHETNTIFLPRRLIGNVIQIRSLKSGKFCKRLTARGLSHFLAIQRSYEDPETKMEIEEPVISREMKNFEYYIEDAKKYNETVTAVVTNYVTNDRKSGPMTQEIVLRNTVTDTTNWNNSHALKVGFEVSATAKIPIVGETGLKLSSDYTFTKEHGGVKEETRETVATLSVPVEPMTKTEGYIMETRVSYDIPYSYAQHDVLKTGAPKPYTKNGICTVNNGYIYKTGYEDKIPLE